MMSRVEFKIGDYLVYRTVGACRVKDIGTLEFRDDNRRYYTLVPAFDQDSTIYTPVDNDKVMIRPLISKTEANDFINHLPELKPEEYSNNNERFRACKKMLASGDRNQWAAVVYGMFQIAEGKRDKGKSISTGERESLEKAEKLLFGELALALEIDIQKVPEYIEKLLN